MEGLGEGGGGGGGEAGGFGREFPPPPLKPPVDETLSTGDSNHYPYYKVMEIIAKL